MNAVQSLVLVEKRDAGDMAGCQKGQLVPHIGDKKEMRREEKEDGGWRE
jgi:hypothetical protein